MKFRQFDTGQLFLNGKRLDEDCQDNDIIQQATRETLEVKRRYEIGEVDISGGEWFEVQKEPDEPQAQAKNSLSELLEKTKPKWKKENKIIPSAAKSIIEKNDNSQNLLNTGRKGLTQKPLTEKQKRRSYYLALKVLFGWKTTTSRKYFFETGEENAENAFAEILKKSFQKNNSQISKNNS